MSSLLLPDADSAITQRLVYTREFLEGLRNVPSDPVLKQVALNFIEREMVASLDLDRKIANQARRVPYKSSFDATTPVPYLTERRKQDTRQQRQPRQQQKPQWNKNASAAPSPAAPSSLPVPVMIQQICPSIDQLDPQQQPRQTSSQLWTRNVCESLFSAQPFGGLLALPEQLQPEFTKIYSMNRTDFIASGPFGLSKKSQIELAAFQGSSESVLLAPSIASQPAAQALKARSLTEDYNPPVAQSRRTFVSRGVSEDKENLLENLSMRANATMSKAAPRSFASVVSAPNTQSGTPKKTIEQQSLPESADDDEEDLLSSKSAHHDPNEGKSPEEIIAARLVSREKQIQYGYNTVGYQRYVATIPKDKRGREMPRTPDKHQTCSKRSWDGQVRKWRRSLHMWDPAELQEEWIQKQLDAAREDENAEDMVIKLVGDGGLGLDLADHHDTARSDAIDFV